MAKVRVKYTALVAFNLGTVRAPTFFGPRAHWLGLGLGGEFLQKIYKYLRNISEIYFSEIFVVVEIFVRMWRYLLEYRYL